MKSIAGQTKSNGIKPAAENTGKASNANTFQFADHRPQTVAQLQRQETVNNFTVQRAVNKNGLPAQLQSGIESLSGISMSDVQVHYNSPQPAQLQAHAYAQGSNIHIAPGQEKHLPHEAWHVVQQKQGRVQPTMQMKSVSVNDSPSLEREADVMGAKAAAVQLKCAACNEEDTKQMKMAGNTVQRVLCNPTNRGGEQLHDYVVNHLANTLGWSKEYHVQDGGGGNRYADLVTPGRQKVYEVKSNNVGAATAQQEATLYAGWMNATCNTNTDEGGWSQRSQFNMGSLGKACIRGHGGGGITYERTDADTACTDVL